MRKSLLCILLAGYALANVLCAWAEGSRGVAIEWRGYSPRGELRITDGSIDTIKLAKGSGTVIGSNFAAKTEGPFRLELQVTGTSRRYGAGGTVITVHSERNPFSFYLRDVNKAYPICIPAYGVAVTESGDARSFREILDAARSRGLQTKIQHFETEPEEDYAQAAAGTRQVACQTWLGLSRDIRLFAVSQRLDWVQPRFHGMEVSLPETRDQPTRYDFLFGRGWSAVERITRHLEEGTLPILHGTLDDDDIQYNLTAFAGLETKALRAENVRGTHFLVADGHGLGHMLTAEQQAVYDSLLPAEMNQPEETVLYVKITAVNATSVPRYAFFRNPVPSAVPASDWSLEGINGFGRYRSGRVFCVSKLNGAPLAQEELAILLAPGEKADFEFYLPHRPIPSDRARMLLASDFEERRSECREYWKRKLASAARISLPEQRIDEMLRAGLLHLDLVTYGLEPKGTLTSTIGVYSAIGSESSPIIQFLDSMGWHDVARRSLQYFLDKQHEDGFIQNFGGYMLETGAALWSIGEHYRYTRDRDWARQIEAKLIKSCEYLERWRARNLREELRGKGYGMLEGKTADPEDPFRSFMLNGYAYLGLARVAEMLDDIDPSRAEKWHKEADGLKGDIRSAFFDAMGRSPVIPLTDGTWCPTAPPWVEARGPLALFTDGGKWFTHGAMVSRDSLLGPLYLVFQEVLEPEEAATEFLLNFHNDLMTRRNVAFSQPYYSRHSVIHLRRGEVKPFLKAYYNTFSSLADRQTYTFWEHFFGASPHKTHEEGWFLMDSRWMLYMERGHKLEFLPGIPRAYLEDGKRIDLENVATYFGPATLHVQSNLEQDRIEAKVDCHSDRMPESIEIRLPHPDGRKATWVRGGLYDPDRERVRVSPFRGHAEITLGFGEVRN